MRSGVAGGWQRTTHPEAQWFPAAGAGLFIHWGISSVLGKCDLSWGMVANTPWDAAAGGANKLTPNQYYALAECFQPDSYNPDEWMRLARDAGFQYAVLTTKHHDGYTLWPSKFGRLGTHTHMGGRDLVGPFVEACRGAGLKVGLYYSPPDWYFDRHYRSWGYAPSRPSQATQTLLDMDHHPVGALPPRPPGHDAARAELVRGQVRELLTRWGRIDLFWFDGGNGEMDPAEVRAMQPHIVINNRNGGVGDYDHSECRLPAHRPTGWFETCYVCWGHGGWGYIAGASGDTAAQYLDKLVRIRTWGGNLLANIGPDGHGRFPSEYMTAWRQIGQWMSHSGQSIVGAQEGPYPEHCSVPVTRKGQSFYLLPPSDHSGPLRLMGLGAPPAHVRLLRTGHEAAWRFAQGELSVELRPQDRSGLVDAVAVEFG
jgi:alpha-L-fucosidase